MLLSDPNSGTKQCSFTDGDGDVSDDAHRLSEDLDSGCSTPYVSAPSSPGRGPSGYFFSAPASPMHFLLSSKKEHEVCSASEAGAAAAAFLTLESSGSFEFEFSSRLFSSTGSNTNGLMSSADELFLNGQIRPMKLSSHLQRPQILAPLIDLDGEDDEEAVAWSVNGSDQFSRGRDLRARNKSVHRKARSMSPLRNGDFNWHASIVKVDGEEEEEEEEEEEGHEINEENNKESETPSIETTPSCSASSSRSSSSGRNSKKWIFLKDLLHRSKSEGRANTKERFWSTISFSPSKEKKLSSPVLTPSSSRDEKKEKEEEKEKKSTPEKIKRKGSKQGLVNKKSAAGKPANGVSKRRVPPSAHELHYTANRAQAEEMKKKTFLPYRQGLLGCLGFSSKSYGALNGLTKSLNPISSR